MIVKNTRFKPGDPVRVRMNHTTGHCRTPHFVQGKTGTIAAIHGRFPNPENRAYGGNGLPYPTLYQVRFKQIHLWETYTGPETDTLHIDLFEHWLELVQ